MRRFGTLSLVFAICALILPACSKKPPSDELAKVEKAFADARTALVDKYAAKKFKEYEKALAETKTLLDEKKFDEAKKNLEALQKKMTDLVVASEKLKEKMKAEAVAELPKVESEVAAAREKFGSEEKKLDEEARKATEESLKKSEETLAEIKKAVDAGEYWGLKAKFAFIRNKLAHPTGGGAEAGPAKGEKKEEAAPKAEKGHKGDKGEKAGKGTKETPPTNP